MYNGGNTLEREGIAMEEQNRIRIKLAGKEYVVITERDEGFVLRCAEHLNRGIEEILLANPAAGTVDAALLCAMNFLEEMELKRGAAEELKRQLKTCFEEQAQWKAQEWELEGAGPAGRAELTWGRALKSWRLRATWTASRLRCAVGRTRYIWG